MAQPPNGTPGGFLPGSSGGPGRPSAQDTGTTASWDDLAITLTGLARSLHQEDDPHLILDDVVAAGRPDPRDGAGLHQYRGRPPAAAVPSRVG